MFDNRCAGISGKIFEISSFCEPLHNSPNKSDLKIKNISEETFIICEYFYILLRLICKLLALYRSDLMVYIALLNPATIISFSIGGFGEGRI